MSVVSVLNFDFGDLNGVYYELLKGEDFNFKTKDIGLDVFFKDENLSVEFSYSNFLEFKIGVNALLKSLEVIGKTLEV